jgi:hypothetical protein
MQGQKIIAEAQRMQSKAKDLTQSAQRKPEDTEKDKNAQPGVAVPRADRGWLGLETPIGRLAFLEGHYKF